MNDLGPFWLSLRVAALATVLIVAVGLPAAWVLARWRFPGKALVAGLLVLPLVLPPTVLGYYLLQILGRRAWSGTGWSRRWASRSSSTGRVRWWPRRWRRSRCSCCRRAGRSRRSTRRLEDVARLLGRSERSVFLAVTLPLAWRGLAAGVVLAFARSLGDFGATLMVAGNIPGLTQTAALAIYDAVSGQRRGARRPAHAPDLRRLDRGPRGRPAHLAGAEGSRVERSARRGPGRSPDPPGPSRA